MIKIAKLRNVRHEWNCDYCNTIHEFMAYYVLQTGEYVSEAERCEECNEVNYPTFIYKGDV